MSHRLPYPIYARTGRLGPATSPVADVAARGFIAELESLRGIAIILVFVLHADVMISGVMSPGGPTVSPWRAWVLGGHTGVSLFFILSGFLLSRPFLAEAAGGERLERSRYYARRVLRIMPLYSLAIVIAVLLRARAPADLLHAMRYLVFLNSFGETTMPFKPFSFVWWSLATEVQFYLVLPFLPVFLRSRRGRLTGTIALVVYAAAYTAFASGIVRMATMSAQHQLAHSLLGRAPLFAFGILAAAVYQAYGTRLRAAAFRAAWLRRGGPLLARARSPQSGPKHAALAAGTTRATVPIENAAT